MTPVTSKKSLVEILEIIAAIALSIATLLLMISLIITVAYVYDFAVEFLELMYSQ